MSQHPIFESIRSSQTLARVGIAGIAVVAFLVTANLVTPDLSRATDGPAMGRAGLPGDPVGERPEQDEVSAEKSSSEGWPVWLHDAGPDSGTAEAKSLGTIRSREYVVQIHATPEGPRYTVFDIEGRVIGRNMLPAEVRRAAPDLNLDTLMAGPDRGTGVGTDEGEDDQPEAPIAIMLAERREFFE